MMMLACIGSQGSTYGHHMVAIFKNIITRRGVRRLAGEQEISERNVIFHNRSDIGHGAARIHVRRPYAHRRGLHLSVSWRWPMKNAGGRHARNVVVADLTRYILSSHRIISFIIEAESCCAQLRRYPKYSLARRLRRRPCGNRGGFVAVGGGEKCVPGPPSKRYVWCCSWRKRCEKARNGAYRIST